jgi:hypothetical protein
MEGRFDVVGEFVALFSDDRELGGELPHGGRELVDLGGRRMAAREEAEVDPDLDAGLVLLAHAERDLGVVDERVHTLLVSGCAKF